MPTSFRSLPKSTVRSTLISLPSSRGYRGSLTKTSRAHGHVLKRFQQCLVLLLLQFKKAMCRRWITFTFRTSGLVKSRSRSQPSKSEESSSPSVSINISTRRVADARGQFGDDSEELSPLPDDDVRVRAGGARVIFPRSVLARYAEARAKERSGYDADEDTDDDVIELDGPPRDESVRAENNSALGAADDVQGAAERRSVL